MQSDRLWIIASYLELPPYCDKWMLACDTMLWRLCTWHLSAQRQDGEGPSVFFSVYDYNAGIFTVQLFHKLFHNGIRIIVFYLSTRKMIHDDVMSSSVSLYSHGWLLRSARVGACWGVRCGSIPVPDPRSARASNQLGEKQPPSGHQGRQVGQIVTAWHLLEVAAFHRLFTRAHGFCFFPSFALQVHPPAYRGSADHRSARRGQWEVLLCGP